MQGPCFDSLYTNKVSSGAPKRMGNIKFSFTITTLFTFSGLSAVTWKYVCGFGRLDIFKLSLKLMLDFFFFR